MKSTNYFNTLIEVAPDCAATHGEIPPVRGERQTVASLQYALLSAQPYALTSDDVIFAVHATRQGIPTTALAEQRALFFAKDQPCLRASPLTKRYGWGIHSTAEGMIALIGVEADAYRRLQADDSVTKIQAMRSRRA